MVNRREFLINYCATAVVAGVLPAPVFAAGDSGGVSAGLRKDNFTGLVNQRFYFYDSMFEHRGMTQLVAVEDIPTSGAGGAALEQFALVFRTSTYLQLPGGLYNVISWSMPGFQLYIQPTTSNGDWQYYAAEFSLLL